MLEIDKENFPNVIHIKDKEINEAVKLMNPELKIPTSEFRQQCEIIYQKLLPVYFENLNGNKNNIGLTIVLRAADSGLLAMKEYLFTYNMPVFNIWTARNEVSIQAEILRANLPNEIADEMPALILDLVCATATSSIITISELKKRGFKDITCIFGVASKNGLKTLRDNYPDVKNIVGFTGSNIGLDDNGYIIYLDSGKLVVGDAGDRWTRITSKGILLK